MPGTPFDLYGNPSRVAPPTVPDNIPALTPAFDPYKGQRVTSAMPGRQALADMGLTWRAGNPAVGTGVAHALVASFANDTAALFAIKNEEPSGGKNLYLDLLQLLLTAAPTGTVSMEFVFKVFTSKDQTPTANGVEITPVHTNKRNPAGVVLPKVWAFNGNSLTVPGSGANALQSDIVARCRIPTSLGIVGDEYMVKFGSEEPQPTPGLTATRATAVGRFLGYAPAFPIPPQAWCNIYRFWLTEAAGAPSFEYQLSGFFW